MTKISKEKLLELKVELKLKGFKYTQSNGMHMFLNAAILQGIELNGEVINPFCVGDDMDRIYGIDNVGNEVRDACKAIEQVISGRGVHIHKDEDIPVSDGELMDTSQDVSLQEADQTYGIVPQYLTDELIKKHPGTIPMLISMQKTDPDQIKELTDSSGKPLKIRGKTVRYVDTAYMTTALNYATLMDWSFEVLESREDTIDKKKHFSVLGCLTIHSTEGKDIMKQQWGSQVLKSKMEVGDALKAAASDSMKKCASMFGIAADIYGCVV